VFAATGVLAGRPTLLMSRGIYATPVLLGCTVYVMLRAAGFDHRLTSGVSAALIFAIRAAAIRWHIEMPHWLTSE
jgi:uncharacterized membrane protein YeiH